MDNELIQQITDIETEYDYEEEVVMSKFLKKHGHNYSQEDLLKFLRKRYEVINRFNGPDDV